RCLHGSSDKPHHVECSDQVDAYDALVVGERHRAIAADDPPFGSDAGAVDKDAGRAMHSSSFLDSRFTAGAVGNIARDSDTLEFARDLAGSLFIDIGDRNLGGGL